MVFDQRLLSRMAQCSQRRGKVFGLKNIATFDIEDSSCLFFCISSISSKSTPASFIYSNSSISINRPRTCEPQPISAERALPYLSICSSHQDHSFQPNHSGSRRKFQFSHSRLTIIASRASYTKRYLHGSVQPTWGTYPRR